MVLVWLVCKGVADLLEPLPHFRGRGPPNRPPPPPPEKGGVSCVCSFFLVWCFGMWFGGFSKLSRLFGGLFVVVFCFPGFFAVFMAFVFLLGGPSAEAGPFLRSSGYIYTANKRANIWPTRPTRSTRPAPRPRPCKMRARSRRRRAHGHAQGARAATNARAVRREPGAWVGCQGGGEGALRRDARPKGRPSRRRGAASLQ